MLLTKINYFSQEGCGRTPSDKMASKTKRPLRIPCSSIASLVGLHPFQSPNFPELFFNFLYQGDNELKIHDCLAIGVELVDEEEILVEVLGGQGRNRLRKEWEGVLSDKSASVAEASAKKERFMKVVSEGQKKVRNAEKVLGESRKELQEKVLAGERKEKRVTMERRVAELEEKLKKAVGEVGEPMTEAQRNLLENMARKKIDCGFGNNHEDDALNEYERRTGNSVGERNTEFLYWNFPSDEAKAPITTVNGEEFSPDTLFTFVGVADGISSELSVDREEDRVVVECKHRMNDKYFGKNARPPPFYDLIQLVSYMLMYDIERGDLLQCLRSNLNPTTKSDKKIDDETKKKIEANRQKALAIRKKKIEQQSVQQGQARSSTITVKHPLPGPQAPPVDSCSPTKTVCEINITRISLRSPDSNHAQNFAEHIIPKLYCFARAVDVVKASDSRRRHLVLMMAMGDVLGLKDFFIELGLDYVRYIDGFGGRLLEKCVSANGSANEHFNKPRNNLSPARSTRSKRGSNDHNKILDRGRKKSSPGVSPERKKELKALLDEFCNDGRARYAFDTNLTSSERKVVHSEVKGREGISSSSLGEGKNRFVVVEKLAAPNSSFPSRNDKKRKSESH